MKKIHTRGFREKGAEANLFT